MQCVREHRAPGRVCSTLGVFDRIRVPAPAARTMTAVCGGMKLPRSRSTLSRSRGPTVAHVPEENIASRTREGNVSEINHGPRRVSGDPLRRPRTGGKLTGEKQLRTERSVGCVEDHSARGRGVRGSEGLRRQDSNLNYLNQNQRCCHYTTADYRAPGRRPDTRERSSHADAPCVEPPDKFLGDRAIGWPLPAPSVRDAACRKGRWTPVSRPSREDRTTERAPGRG